MGMQSYQNEQLGRGSTSQSIRHIVALIDGTWVSASRRAGKERYSNVYKLGLYIETHNEANESQFAFYSPGLGSETSGLRWGNGIFSVQLPLEVEKAYINICANYCWDEGRRGGDKIYIFGFSRGAVVARLVAALIGRYGLLRPSQIEMFPYIWADFIKKRPIPDIDAFKHKYCLFAADAKIEFLGLFDTVYGIHWGSQHKRLKKVFFENRILGSGVKVAIHLLARDESRRVFRPILFESACCADQILEQIWMPGVHSDIGGGYAEDFLSKIALMTMLDRVREYTALKIDFERSLALREAIEEAFGENRIVLNDEHQGVFRFDPTRWWGRRCPNGADQCQSIHPIYKDLEGRCYVTKNDKPNLFHRPEFPFDKVARVASLENLCGRTL